MQFTDQQENEYYVIRPIECEDDMEKAVEPPAKEQLGAFHRFLTIWILLSMAAGIILGNYLPQLVIFLEHLQIAKVSIPTAVLLWGIILPMMIQVDFTSLKNVFKQPRAIVLTVIVNYGIQPFSMYALCLLFFKVIFASYLSQEKQTEYLIGSVLLGGAPCTAMVFIWSKLMNGDAAYTITQVAVNDLILLVLYVPTVQLLAGVSNIQIPWTTLMLSVVFFVVIPLVIGVLVRQSLIYKHENFLNKKLLPVMDQLSMVFLLLMVILLFISQAPTIIGNLLDILVISVPLIIQTIFIWAITVAASLLLKIPFRYAGPASLIACSNFFEMAVAVAFTLYGSDSGVTLTTVVGVLIEVPIMLTLVHINNRMQNIFHKSQNLV